MQPNPIGTNPLPVTAGTQICILNTGAPRQPTTSDSGSAASSISGTGNGDSLAHAAGIYAPLSPVAKRKKPKNNIAKTNSSFVSRIITNESLPRRLADRKTDDIYAFVNVTRAYEWLDLTTADKAIPLAKLLFTRAHPTSHDINPFTRTNDHIDAIIGFSTGDIIWFECFSQKYMRLNKQVCPFPIASNHRAASILVQYDKYDGSRARKIRL
jgi:catabolite repression protein CreC